MIYWGLDSSVSVSRPQGSTRRSIVQRMLRWLAPINRHRPAQSQLPHFWGRYLVDASASHTNATPLNSTEVQHIVRETNGQCRILLIYVNASNDEMRTGGRRSGLRHATNASTMAGSALPHSRAGTCIYLDVEPGWRPSADWLLGWWQGIERTPFVSGIYCNLNSQNAGFIRAYCEALQRPEVARLRKTRYIWAAQPKYISNRDCRRPGRSVLAQSTLAYPGLSQPFGLPARYADQACRVAAQPPRDQVVLWQYWGNCVPSYALFPAMTNPDAGYFDMNLATRAAFDSLWH